ncbi:MAG: signal peptide peptidase SppA [Flavobacteriales bacterium]|nr:signal peptide peptidase SppA [Flavobacteriales bacterium]
MKKFIKNVLSTLIGIILSFAVIVIVLIGILSIASSQMNNNEKPIKENSILKIDLSSEVVERSSSNPLSNIDFTNPEPKKQIGLKKILDNIEKAKSDKNIIAIYIYSPFVNAGLSKTEEIRNKLLEFKKSGKPIISYNEIYSTKGYYLSSVADKIYLNPMGIIDHKGAAATIMFFKGLLEKLNIDIQIFKVGKFKSAVEPFILDKMSSENRIQLKLMLNSLNDNIMDSIASQRNLSLEKVQRDADQLTLTSAQICLEEGYIDGLIYEDQIEDTLKAMSEENKLNLISLKNYSSIKTKKKDISRNKIAIVYANGEINSGEGDLSNIGSKTTSAAIKKAREDKNVKAIVLRVNSPGGSALASDVIWRETTLAKKVKPLVVSMGDYAASGGYYISCAADTIVANPTTLTGSIGVFGMIPNMKDFYESNFGITIDTVKTNKYSDMGINRRLTTYEKNSIQKGVEDIYTDFITKVGKGRNMSNDAVDEIGQGRIWSGYDAKEIGLVDVYGGLEKAISIAVELAEIENYRVISLPKEEDPLTKIINDLKQTKLSNLLNDEFDFINTQHIKTIKNLIKSDNIQTRIPYLIELE